MRVIEPTRYRPPKHRKNRRWVLALPVFAILAATINYARPLPAPVAATHVSLPAATTEPPIAWPGQGQAAVAADGYGLLGTHGDMTPLSTASIAKVIVALCVLEKQPLATGHSGLTYTIGANDVADYERYANIGGSLIPVTEGEQLTEYQALQALMIPSANNIADSLVRWEFGGHDGYKSYAADYLRRHGLNQTRIGSDASGYEPDTVSTATDVTNLGLLALKNPVLMEIARQKSTTLPVAGKVTNYNAVLGVNGITGLKTGNNDADPGAFLFTATAHIGGTDVLTTGAVMGAPDLGSALHDSTELAASLQAGFEQVRVVSAGESIGTLRAAWGATATVVPDRTVGLVRWKSTALAQTHKIDATKRSGVVGSLKVTAGQAQSKSSLRLKAPLPGPSFWWRLTRH